MKKLFSAQETADLIGVSVQVVYELKRIGRLGIGSKIGHRLYFSDGEIQNYLDRSNGGKRRVTVDDLILRHQSKSLAPAKPEGAGE